MNPKPATSPPATADDPRRGVMFRPLLSQLTAIDERAAQSGLTRNAWIERALTWALAQPAKKLPKG